MHGDLSKTLRNWCFPRLQLLPLSEGWYWGIQQRATYRYLVATRNIWMIFVRNLQQLARFGVQPPTITSSPNFPNFTNWSKRLFVKKIFIWEPATNSFWQLATNMKIMSISATIDRNLATDTLSKYLNTSPFRIFITSCKVLD